MHKMDILLSARHREVTTVSNQQNLKKIGVC